MRTSFHHQPEAQHPHSPAIYTPAGRLPHLLGQKRTNRRRPKFKFVRCCQWSQRIDATLYLIGKRWSVTMDQRFRRGFTATEKTELWDRWQRGESLKAIGRAFGKPSSSIYNQVAPHGGIRPLPRRRSQLALTLLEREEISRGIAAHQSARSMARLLGRSPSTVSRELKRNGGYDGYRAAPADEQARGPDPVAPNGVN